MKLNHTIILLFFLLILEAGVCASEPSTSSLFIDRQVEGIGLGGTPWESKISIDEERSRAWMSALHNAYNSILSVPLMEGKTVRQVLISNPNMRERLGVILLLAPKFFYQSDATGLVRCKVEVPLDGKQSIKSALYLESLRPLPLEPYNILASWTHNDNANESYQKTPFKRIAIDLRGFNYEPSLFPRFFDEKGVLIYQETMTIKGERLSRPTIKFTSEIKDVYKDLEETEVALISAKINPLSKRDIQIIPPDTQIFERFCKEIINEPASQNEILIVFNPLQKDFSGKLEKEKEKK